MCATFENVTLRSFLCLFYFFHEMYLEMISMYFLNCDFEALKSIDVL